jgi:transposase
MKHDQIVTLWNARKSAVWIAEHLGIHRETVSDHLKAEGISLPRGRPSGGGRKPAIIPEGVATDLRPPGQNRQLLQCTRPPTPPPVKSKCEPNRAFIEERVRFGQPAQVIWQDMVDELGFQGGYNSVKRFVRKIKGAVPEVFAVIATEPGLEAQVDYGRGALTIHPETGKYRRPWLFSMKLSHSRKAFRKVVWKSSSRTWCELHEEGFRHFGGVPKIIRLDNLKEGVIKPDIYDPGINPLYAAMLAYYNAVAIPCRVGKPEHKGKVESDIKYAQNTLKGRNFDTLECQQDFLDRWNERWADTRIHGTVKRQVREMFESEEKPALQPLPLNNFPVLSIVSRKVHSDGHIKVENAYYSAPPQWIHKDVMVHVGRCFVDIFNSSTGERLARHGKGKIGQYHTDQSHLPPAKRIDGLHKYIMDRADGIGPNTAAVVCEILRQRPYHAIRSAQGIIALSRKHPKEQIESAAAICVERGAYTYRCVKNLVDRKETPECAPPELTQKHPLIRESSAYQEMWLSGAFNNESTHRKGQLC